MATSYSGTEENNYWKVADYQGNTLRHTTDCPRGTYKKGDLMNHFKGFKDANQHAKGLAARAVRV